MSEQFKGRSIFDVVAERRKRSRILSRVAGIDEEDSETETSEAAEALGETSKVSGEPELAPVCDDRSVEAPVSQEVEESVELDSTLDAKAVDEREESLPPQVVSGIEETVWPERVEESELPVSESEAPLSEEVAPIEEREEVSADAFVEESSEESMADVSLIEAASEVAKEEIDSSIEEEVAAEKEEEEIDEIAETVEAMDPIIDLLQVPKTQPSRVLRKTSKNGGATGGNAKKSSTGGKEKDSKVTKKGKRVTLLDRYFSDL